MRDIQAYQVRRFPVYQAVRSVVLRVYTPTKIDDTVAKKAVCGVLMEDNRIKVGIDVVGNHCQERLQDVSRRIGTVRKDQLVNAIPMPIRFFRGDYTREVREII